MVDQSRNLFDNLCLITKCKKNRTRTRIAKNVQKQIRRRCQMRFILPAFVQATVEKNRLERGPHNKIPWNKCLLQNLKSFKQAQIASLALDVIKVEPLYATLLAKPLVITSLKSSGQVQLEQACVLGILFYGSDDLKSQIRNTERKTQSFEKTLVSKKPNSFTW